MSVRISLRSSVPWTPSISSPHAFSGRADTNEAAQEQQKTIQLSPYSFPFTVVVYSGLKAGFDINPLSDSPSNCMFSGLQLTPVVCGLLQSFKGIIHPQVLILSYFSHFSHFSHLRFSFYAEHKRKLVSPHNESQWGPKVSSSEKDM